MTVKQSDSAVSKPRFMFERDVNLEPSDCADTWTYDLSGRWNIGDNPNGGYLQAGPIEAMLALTRRPDVLSVTTHFLRPGTAGAPAEVHAWTIREGSTVTNAAATLTQANKQRLQVSAVLGDLTAATPGHTPGGLDLNPEPPPIPPPEECVSRSNLEQGVDLSILESLDIRIHPDMAMAGENDEARIVGWIRFADGREVDAKSLCLFGDAFPPSLFSLLGFVGWVPTIELTTQVRRNPAPGWILGEFETRDLNNGRFIEDGKLWDCEGNLVAQSRQLAMLLVPSS